MFTMEFLVSRCLLVIVSYKFLGRIMKKKVKRPALSIDQFFGTLGCFGMFDVVNPALATAGRFVFALSCDGLQWWLHVLHTVTFRC